MNQEIRMACLELAVRAGSKSPLVDAELYLAFVTGAGLNSVAVEPPKWIAAANAIIARVCAEQGVSIEDILSPRRTAPLVAARDAVIAAVWTEITDLSLPMMGKIFRKDHTSILTSLRRSGVPSRRALQESSK